MELELGGGWMSDISGPGEEEGDGRKSGSGATTVDDGTTSGGAGDVKSMTSGLE